MENKIASESMNKNTDSTTTTEYFDTMLSEALNGDPEAQIVLGTFYENGEEGTKIDKEKARYWYRKAAESDSEQAQYYSEQAQYYLEALYRKEHVEEFKYAAEQGDAAAQVNLGLCYENGEGVERDRDKAIYWFQKAAAKNNTDAMLELAAGYRIGIIADRNNTQAAYWYQKAAEQGDSNAQYELGCCYQRGDGVAYNIEQALFWYQKAGEQGNLSAQKELADYYNKLSNSATAEPGSISDSQAEAAYWYQKAADQGDAKSQAQLGSFYHWGLGVKKDKKKAIYWYQKAAEQGDPIAQYSLGLMYLCGDGVEKNRDKGIKLLEESSAQGYYQANWVLENPDKYEQTTDNEQKKESEKQEASVENQVAHPKARSHYIDWFIVFMEIGAIVAAFIFTKGTPLYIYTEEHHREISFLLKPLLQLAAITASTLGGGAALGLMLAGISPPLLFLGGIAGGIGGLITIFCYEDPGVYMMAVNIAKAVALLAVIEIVFQLMRSLVGRK